MCSRCLQYLLEVDGIRIRSLHSVWQVLKINELDHWKLYLVDWGYNTREERARATSHPRIQVVKRDQLALAMSSQ